MRLIDADMIPNYKLDVLLEAGEMKVPRKFRIAHWKDIEEVPMVDPESLPIVKQLRAELEKVKAERDAAIRNVEWLVTGEIKACDYCKKNNPYNYTCERMEMGYCADWEWCGVQGENNS